ncbi:MAG: transglycosylase domain-containing protein, partial [Burkholderiaceae bacterium]
QQLARNLFPEEIGRERSLNRKLREIITARRIERLYSKDEILETYLNTADFLYNAVGIEAAAHTYFDKPASALDVSEAATLVGMLKGTSYYNPVQQPERAKARRNVVLAQMVKRGVLTPERFAALRDVPLVVHFTREAEPLGSAPHFALHVRKWLAEWSEKNHHDLYEDGLTIVTTLDTRLQVLASQAVTRQADLLQQIADVEWSAPALRAVSTTPDAYVKARPKVDPFGYLWNKRADLVMAFVRDSAEFRKLVADKVDEPTAASRLMADADFMRKLRNEKTRLEAGFVAIDPASGEVKAWVGSRDFELGQFDHVAQAARQPGSTFKPFVYGAALQAGIDPDKTYLDGEVEIALGNGKVWKPTDMGGASGAPMSLRDGLTYSKNTITAQVMQEVGAARVVALAKAMGVDRSKLDPVPSLALGTSDVTLLEMVSSYATIAREGQYHAPVVVKRIVDRNGKVVAEFGAETRRALNADAALDLTDMLRGVVTRGTGTQIQSRFGITADVAGKTGTTQNNTDGWFILMQPQLVAGAWVGFNDTRVTLRSNHWGQGGHNAILLVGDFFREAFKAGRLDAKARFDPPRHPAPAAPAVPSTLPSTLPEDAADAGAPSRAAGWIGAREREPRVRRETAVWPLARDESSPASAEAGLPRWRRAVPARRAAHDADELLIDDPSASGARRRGRNDADAIAETRRDGAELLRNAPEADREAARRERERGPDTRASFGIAPALPALPRDGD